MRDGAEVERSRQLVERDLVGKIGLRVLWAAGAAVWPPADPSPDTCQDTAREEATK